jgi:hypothetical protein
MEQLARNRRYFTFLSDSPATISVVIGDGRLTLARAPDAAYDLVIVDAFSSDAIPVHLITREALELYLTKLRPGGVIAFHISNQIVDLEPVLGALARSVSIDARILTSLDRQEAGILGARWVVLGKQLSAYEQPAGGGGWRPLRAFPRPWTDDFSNVIQAIRLGD